MAERRRTGGTGQTRSRARPAGRDEQEVVDEDETEPWRPDEREAAEEGDEPAAADRGESAGGSGESGSRRDARRNGSPLTARQAARAALRQVLELTDKQAESITGVEHGKYGWTVTIEVVEDRRIPSSADILATYDVSIDGDGELMSYRRARRYSRGRGDSN